MYVGPFVLSLSLGLHALSSLLLSSVPRLPRAASDCIAVAAAVVFAWTANALHTAREGAC